MSTTTLSPSPETRTAMAVLWALSLCHMLNDTIQSLLPAIYPVLQANYALSFTQIGVLHFAFQCTAALLQPVVGNFTDKRPSFRLLPLGMGMSLTGLLILASAGSYPVLLVAAMGIGLGSAIFHPDASRFARAASGGRYGFAQSVFQVGGNAGTAIGPLLAAYIVLPFGQGSIAWFTALAFLGMIVLWNVGTWAQTRHRARAAAGPVAAAAGMPQRRVVAVIGLLALLVFTKHIYIAGLATFYTFYLIETFGRRGTRRRSLLLRPRVDGCRRRPAGHQPRRQHRVGRPRGEHLGRERLDLPVRDARRRDHGRRRLPAGLPDPRHHPARHHERYPAVVASAATTASPTRAIRAPLVMSRRVMPWVR